MQVFDSNLFFEILTSSLIINSVWVTIWVAVCSQSIGIAIGLISGPMLLSNNKIIYSISWIYLWIFKGTPLLAQILFFYSALPQMGIKLNLIATGLLALGINEGARMAEIIRSGLISVPITQHEAAKALGLNKFKSMIFIVFPQAFRIILPPLGNNFIYMIKATSLLSVISFSELMRVSQQLSQSTTRPLEIYLAAAIWYLLLITIWTIIQNRIENSLELENRKPASSIKSTNKKLNLAFANHKRIEKDYNFKNNKKIILEAKNLNYKIGEFKILDDIDFKLYEGEKVVIMGPSGSGKSTLLKTLNWITVPDKGDVCFERKSLGYKSNSHGKLIKRPNNEIEKTRQKIGMVFQQFSLFQTQTAAENVSLGLRILKKEKLSIAKEKAHKLLDKVGLKNKYDSYPIELSGGQRQRVAIARALSMSPSILLFDEPTSSLDPETVGGILNLISDLASQNISMVIITHEVSFAQKVADRIVFMENGKISLNLPVEKAFNIKSHNSFNKFISELN